MTVILILMNYNLITLNHKTQYRTRLSLKYPIYCIVLFSGQYLAMFSWPNQIRLLSSTPSCKLICSFCGLPPPPLRRPYYGPQNFGDTYLVQFSEDISVHRNCLTCSTELDWKPGMARTLSSIQMVEVWQVAVWFCVR